MQFLYILFYNLFIVLYIAYDVFLMQNQVCLILKAFN